MGRSLVRVYWFSGCCLVFFCKIFDGIVIDVFHKKNYYDFRFLRFYSAPMHCLWITPRTLVVIVIRWLTFHPMVCMGLDEGLYLLEFFLMATLGNSS